ncbi:YbaB/EbfC family nucleoid-associated protein [Nocardia sp. NPDC056611]|uniref:YbaB/EbfC family nucleoid-associated protein n=1 Tax=Nocardia sp. NPDC056611 TaxID=3345877 RepID=UPI00366C6D71
MFSPRNESDELGLKVQRAQHALEQIRGVGAVQGVRVIVDAEDRLLSVTVNEEAIIMAAYQAAIEDKRPKVDEALRELRADPTFEAVSTYTKANSARWEAERMERQRKLEEEFDDDYYERGSIKAPDW